MMDDRRSACLRLRSPTALGYIMQPPPPFGVATGPAGRLQEAVVRVLKPRCASAEIGIGLTGFGFVLTFLGVLFFFDKGLLAMGNVCDHMHSTTACFQPCAVPPLLSYSRIGMLTRDASACRSYSWPAWP